MKPNTIHKEKYTSMFTDVASRYIFGRLLHKKSDTVTHLTEIFTLLDNQVQITDYKPIYRRRWRIYRHYVLTGITQKYTNPGDSEENHLAEKANEYIFDKIRTTLIMGIYIRVHNIRV